MVTGGYVLFDAFVIYEDDVFENLLHEFIEVFGRFSQEQWEDIIHHPKVIHDILVMFKGLCNDHLPTMVHGNPGICQLLLSVISLVVVMPLRDPNGRSLQVACYDILSSIGYFLEQNPPDEARSECIDAIMLIFWHCLFNDAELASQYPYHLLSLCAESCEDVKGKLVAQYPDREGPILVFWEQFRGMLEEVLTVPTKRLEPAKKLREFCKDLSIRANFL
jgi:hypothetical protein